MTVQFRLKTTDGNEIATVFPFNSSDSLMKALERRKVEFNSKNITFDDAVFLMEAQTGLNTLSRIAKEVKRNRRAIAMSLKEGKLKGIKDHFTKPCPKCGVQGDKIKGKEGSGIPFLQCPKCKEIFPTESIYFKTPAFSVGAGPSLDKNGEQLKRVEGKFPIFAVDAALKPLRRLGVTPTYVLSLEWDPLVMKLFEGEDLSDVILLATTGICPDVRKLNWKDMYFFDSSTYSKQGRKFYNKYYGDIGSVIPGGNVTASILALLSGVFADPIIFVGHDFSFPSLDRYFAKGGVKSCYSLNELYRTHDIYGNEVLTNQVLFGYKSWHEKTIKMLHKENGIRFINATEGGILGTTYYDPVKFISLRRKIRKWKYRVEVFLRTGKWISDKEADEKGFKGKNLTCMEYKPLKVIIDELIKKEEI